MFYINCFFRDFINKQFLIKKCEGHPSSPLYVVCDGNNSENTVILGAQNEKKFIMSTKVNVLGHLSKDHESLSLEKMLKYHMMNTQVKNCKVNV